MTSGTSEYTVYITADHTGLTLPQLAYLTPDRISVIADEEGCTVTTFEVFPTPGVSVLTAYVTVAAPSAAHVERLAATLRELLKPLTTVTWEDPATTSALSVLDEELVTGEYAYELGAISGRFPHWQGPVTLCYRDDGDPVDTVNALVTYQSPLGIIAIGSELREGQPILTVPRPSHQRRWFAAVTDPHTLLDAPDLTRWAQTPEPAEPGAPAEPDATVAGLPTVVSALYVAATLPELLTRIPDYTSTRT